MDKLGTVIPIFEIIFSLGSLATSIVAIALTLSTIKSQKIHNVRSVKPIGYITVGDHENEIYVSVINKGIWPLIIKNCTVSIGGKTYENLIDCIPEEIRKSFVWGVGVYKIQSRALLPSDRVHLIHLPFDDINNIFDEADLLKERLRNFMQHVSITILYTDVYDNIYTTSRTLDWFGRRQIDPSTPKQIIRT
jgi:hypothetical protein